jgi:hypothetical protein
MSSKRTTSLSLAFEARRANLPQAIALLIALLLVVGVLFTGTTEEMLAYLLVALACAVPAVLWIWAGGTSIPLLSGFSAMCFIYYGVPILKGTLLGGSPGELSFEPSEILGGAAIVALFLGVATFCWWLVFFASGRRSFAADPRVLSNLYLERFVSVGLILATLFYIVTYTIGLNWLGPLVGLVRAIFLSTGTLAFFFAGHARALGALRGQKWILAVAAMSVCVILSIAGLFIVGGIALCLAGLFGYVMTSKRVPWSFLLITIVIVTILHAGKDRMRDEYWADNNFDVNGGITLLNIPNIMTQWADYGFSKITSDDDYHSAIDRASLMQLLLRAKRLAPNYVPFLEGKTYAVLPYMIVPRFLYPDKITSQTAMNMLNVNFGFLTEEETSKTAVGWGLIAEAYANFGDFGVIGVATAMGILLGLIERWSSGAKLTSFPAVIAVTVLVQLVNMEADVAGLITTLFQSCAGVALIYWLFGILSKKKSTQLRQEANAGDLLQPE